MRIIVVLQANLKSAEIRQQLLEKGVDFHGNNTGVAAVPDCRSEQIESKSKPAKRKPIHVQPLPGPGTPERRTRATERTSMQTGVHCQRATP